MNHIALVGGGPASLVMAIALARRGIPTTVFERDPHPESAPRFQPDRSYTIDTSGHGLRALRYIDATSYFDARVNQFKGIKILGKISEDWNEPGWTGSRGDIQRALMALVEDRHRDRITFHFGSKVTALDVRTGTLTVGGKLGGGAAGPMGPFDWIIGGDGAGSIVRRALEEQCPGFTVTKKSFPMYCTMIELDRVGDRLDRNYLHILSVRPFVVAGAIRGDAGPQSPRWFCAVCTKRPLVFQGHADAVRYFRRRCPRVLELTGDDAIAAFSLRQSQHIGRTFDCSQLYGGRAVLLGDAAAPFPPIGQGLNAALESSMVLDQCVGEAGSGTAHEAGSRPAPEAGVGPAHEAGAGPAQLLEAAALYDARWKPESEAVAWVAERHLAENLLQNLRARLTRMLFGLSVVGETRRSDIPYTEARRKAQRLWPLW